MKYEIDAPDIDGMYIIGTGVDGKYYVTRFSDCYRNGGQNQTEYEHSFAFGSRFAAQRWAVKDLERIIKENY